MSKFTVKTIDVIFTALVAVILGAAIVAVSNYITSGILSVAVGIFIVIALLVLLYYGERILFFLKNKVGPILKNVSAVKLGIVLFFTVAMTKVFFVFLFDIDANLHPDMKNYLSFATQIADSNSIISGIGAAYKWPYEVIFGLFLSPVVAIFGNDTQVVTAYLSVLFAVSSVLLYDVIKYYIGKNLAFVGILSFNLLPVGLFETQLLIHENAIIFFYILSFWILHKALTGKFNIGIKIILVIMSSLLISFGNKINQGGTVVIISYCIYATAYLFINKITLSTFIKVLSLLVCFLICFVSVSKLCDNYVSFTIKGDTSVVEQNKNNRLFLGWSFYLGLNYETSGTWNEEDAIKYNEYEKFDNYEKALEYQKDIIEDRLQTYTESPIKIVSHFFNKIKALWGGMFLPFAYEQGNSLNEFVIYGAGGIINKVLVLLSYMTFIIICSVNLLSFRRPKKKNGDLSPLLQFELMIIGLTMALILFEVMPKYVSYLQIIMFSIALFKLKDFCENSVALSNRKSNFSKKFYWSA